MIGTVICFALALSLLNWLLFVGVTLWVDLPDFRKIITEALKPSAPVPGGMGRTETHAGVTAQAVDGTKLAAAAGSLAGAFKKAGAAPTAAAMSMICLILAAILAGVAKL